MKQVGAATDPSLPDGEGVEDAIIEANEDAMVAGIMVFESVLLSFDNSQNWTGVLSNLRRTTSAHISCHTIVIWPYSSLIGSLSTTGTTPII